MPNLFDQTPNPLTTFFSNLFNKIIKGKRKIGKYIAYAAGTIFILAVIIPAKVPFKARTAYNRAMLAKDNLEAAVYYASLEDFSASLKLSRAAEENFYLAENDIRNIGNNFLISKIRFFRSQADDAENLLKAAGNLSSAVSHGASLARDLENLLQGDKKLSFSKFTIEEKKNILKFISSSSSSFEKIKQDLEGASLDLKDLEFRGFLSQIEDEVEELRLKVEGGKELIAKALPMLEIMPVLFGYPERADYLIALQNNDELRPTGGFLGTFSMMGIEYGEIVECATRDIYHMDMPVQDVLHIEPPAPLKRYLGANKWFMRDSNWSPDWPTSAKRVEWFYKTELGLNDDKEGKATLTMSGAPSQVLGAAVRKNGINEISGVIAITPEVITDLLAITGPVYVEGIEYNKDNFVDILQYRVEKGYIKLGIPSWQRKEVISEIYKEIKIKLFDLPPSRWQEVIYAFDGNLRGKNILVSVNDPSAQGVIQAQGYGGEVKKTAGDYIMAVDANMASLKTDGVMEKSIDYKFEEAGDKMIAKLRVNYINKGEFTWKTTRYRTYTRVYVPKGAKLIRAEGALGNTEIYEEIGKTCFAAFISIEPGKTGSLYFEYELPDYVHDGEQYELYIQKQPGNDTGLNLNLDFSREIQNYDGEILGGTAYGSKVEYSGDLSEDRVFRVAF